MIFLITYSYREARMMSTKYQTSKMTPNFRSILQLLWWERRIRKMTGAIKMTAVYKRPFCELFHLDAVILPGLSDAINTQLEEP